MDCDQGVPVLQARALARITDFTTGTPFTLAPWEAANANATTVSADTFNESVTEDYLFLDFCVAWQVFEKTKVGSFKEEGALVVKWACAIRRIASVIRSNVTRFTMVGTCWNQKGAYQLLDMNPVVPIECSQQAIEMAQLSWPLNIA